MQFRRLVVALLVCTALLGVSVGTASEASDTTAKGATSGDTFCLVKKHDYAVSDKEIEVAEQTADPLDMIDMKSESHPIEDKEWLIYETEYMHADTMCAALDTGPSPVKITLRGVEIHNLTVHGPVMDMGFTYGESDKIVLWISMKSAIKLIPSLLSTSAVSASSTSAANTTSAVTSSGVGRTPGGP